MLSKESGSPSLTAIYVCTYNAIWLYMEVKSCQSAIIMGYVKDIEEDQ